MNMLMQLLPIIVLALFMYFVLIRPQNKQQKKMREMLDSMKIGDEVLTAGGFYGIIYAIDDENVVMEMLPDFNKLMIRKNSIVKVITAEEQFEDSPEEMDEPVEATVEETTTEETSKVEDADFEEVKEETKEDK